MFHEVGTLLAIFILGLVIDLIIGVIAEYSNRKTYFKAGFTWAKSKQKKQPRSVGSPNTEFMDGAWEEFKKHPLRKSLTDYCEV